MDSSGEEAMRILSVVVIAFVVGCASQTGQPANAPPPDDKTIQASGQTMEELFVGRFPGVEVFRAPQGGIMVRIRGRSTFTESTEPLYIIDGSRVQSGAGGLLFLDPQEIAKIQVLKDIGETSIYGSEGANGVIIITTKRR
jgi:TonB-dependent SusC/RagA subfamily outer membrane receptor